MKKSYVKRGKDKKTIKKWFMSEEDSRFTIIYEQFEDIFMNGKLLKGHEHVLLYYIYRNTIGWNDLSFTFNINDAVQKTCLHRKSIYRAINKIVKLGIITKKKDKLGMIITINHPDEWFVKRGKEKSTPIQTHSKEEIIYDDETTRLLSELSNC